MAASSSSDDFSVFVLASDLGVDARPFLQDKWHDCPSRLDDDDDNNNDLQDFTDLDALQFLSLQPAFDKSGNRIFRIVGKYFPGNLLNFFHSFRLFINFHQLFNYIDLHTICNCTLVFIE